MALDVQVVIDQKKALTGAGETLPLIYAGFQQQTVAYTECGSLEEVGEWFAPGSKAYEAARLIFSQSLPPAKVAVFGPAGSALDPDTGLPSIWQERWRQLIVATSEAGEDAAEDPREAIAAYLDARGDKVYFTSVSSLDALDEEDGGLEKFNRLFCLYHPGKEDCPEAALVGATAGKKPGSFTYKNQIIQGLAVPAISPAEAARAEKLGCCTILKKSGDIVTSEGKATSGEYLDILDSRDYIVGEIQHRTQQALNGSDKIPYDNNGITLLESICYNVLMDAYGNGIIAEDAEGGPDFTVNYAPRQQTKEADRAARRYVEGYFEFSLAGAVHEALVRGTILI